MSNRKVDRTIILENVEFIPNSFCTQILPNGVELDGKCLRINISKEKTRVDFDIVIRSCEGVQLSTRIILGDHSEEIVV